MTAKRIAAVLAAAALIVAALLIRSGLDDNSSSATNGTDKPSGGTATVICSTEFKAVCEGLDPDDYTVTVEPAGTTLDRLAGDGAVPPDAWITLDPFPGMVDDTRVRSGLDALAPVVTALATDDPVLAVAASRLDSFQAGCAGKTAWRCIGEAAGQSWDKLLPGEAGTIKVGITDPASEANGLLTFGTAVAGFFRGTDFSANSFTDDPAFVPWMRTMSNPSGVSVDRPPLSTLITQPSFVNVAATTASQAAVSPQPDKFVTVEVVPAFQYIAVVAAFHSRAAGLAATVTPMLTATGWSAAADPQTQLPPGTFIALRKLWKDTT